MNKAIPVMIAKIAIYVAMPAKTAPKFITTIGGNQILAKRSTRLLT
jgi:hypothetical protein